MFANWIKMFQLFPCGTRSIAPRCASPFLFPVALSLFYCIKVSFFTSHRITSRSEHQFQKPFVLICRTCLCSADVLPALMFQPCFPFCLFLNWPTGRRPSLWTGLITPGFETVWSVQWPVCLPLPTLLCCRWWSFPGTTTSATLGARTSCGLWRGTATLATCLVSGAQKAGKGHSGGFISSPRSTRVLGGSDGPLVVLQAKGLLYNYIKNLINHFSKKASRPHQHGAVFTPNAQKRKANDFSQSTMTTKAFLFLYFFCTTFPNKCATKVHEKNLLFFVGWKATRGTRVRLSELLSPRLLYLSLTGENRAVSLVPSFSLMTKTSVAASAFHRTQNHQTLFNAHF